MGGVGALAGMLAKIGALTGAAAEDVGDVLRAAQSLVAALSARGRVLLLLDGTDGLIVHDRQRLPLEVFDASRIRWVLTSRVTTGIADRRIYLGPLDADAAVAILEDTAKRAGATRIEAAPGEMAALAEQLDHLPLALELGGHWLNTLTPQQLMTALARHAGFLTEDEHAGGLQAALAETWARANEEDRAAIIALCALETDFTAEMAQPAGAAAVDRRLARIEDAVVVGAGRHRRWRARGGVAAGRAEARHDADHRQQDSASLHVEPPAHRAEGIVNPLACRQSQLAV
jgi:hypothetical protein